MGLALHCAGDALEDDFDLGSDEDGGSDSDGSSDAGLPVGGALQQRQVARAAGDHPLQQSFRWGSSRSGAAEWRALGVAGGGAMGGEALVGPAERFVWVRCLSGLGIDLAQGGSGDAVGKVWRGGGGPSPRGGSRGWERRRRGC
jgi:hypothetical protein